MPAFVTSLGWHVVLLLIIAFLVGPPKGGHYVRHEPITDPNPRLVFIPQAGPGGGGGGGGDGTPEPPRRADAPGRDRTTVAVAAARQVEPTATPRDADPIPRPVVPVENLAAGLTAMPGTIDAASTLATVSRGSGDGGGSGPGHGPGDGPGRGAGLGDGFDQGIGGRWYEPGNGVTTPAALQRAMPQYTTAAMQARLQGTVVLACVVTPTGVCADIRVVRSLDSTYGLDQEAVKAAGRWRFTPGTRLGRPVPVLVTMEMTFAIR